MGTTDSPENPYRIRIVILLILTIAGLLYLISLKMAFPIFQDTRLVDPLAEMRSLTPLYYIAISLVSISGILNYVYRQTSTGIHVVILMLLGIMLWYTPYYLAAFTWEPDHPRDLGIALQISEVLRGADLSYTDYGQQYPVSYILNHVLIHATGLHYLDYMRIVPLILVCVFIILCYVLTAKITRSPSVAFVATFLAIAGMHYAIFHIGPHVIGVFLALTALILIHRQDRISMVLSLVLILFVIMCHPVSPLILSIFFVAALLSFYPPKRSKKSRAFILIILVTCVAGWNLWPEIKLPPQTAAPIAHNVEWIKVPEDNIPTIVDAKDRLITQPGEWDWKADTSFIPDNLETTERFLLGKSYIFSGIDYLNRSVYYTYALLCIAGLVAVVRKERKYRNGLKDFLLTRGGLNTTELFLGLSGVALVVLTILLGEYVYGLIERSLTFLILIISALTALLLHRIHSQVTRVRGAILNGIVTIFMVVFTLSFPVVSYSIDAYTSQPISEDAGLRFVSSHMTPANRVSTSWHEQMVLYRPFSRPVPRSDTPVRDSGDIRVLRKTNQFYSAMRVSFSFTDNAWIRYFNILTDSTDHALIYYNPSTTVFLRQ